jgi:hypothetical protein
MGKIEEEGYEEAGRSQIMTPYRAKAGKLSL